MRNDKPDEVADDHGRKRISVQDPFYIIAPSPLADIHEHVLKDGESFAVFDRYGDILTTGMGDEGLFHEGTRFLSSLLLDLEGHRPLLLSSAVGEDNGLLTVDLTNPDIYDGDQLCIPKGTLHLFRLRFLWEGACYERLRIRNYGVAAIQTRVCLHYRADFVDVFEVRGSKRPRRGELLKPRASGGTVTLGYRGLDAVERYTRLSIQPKPQTLTPTDACFEVKLEPHGERDYFITTHCHVGRPAGRVKSYRAAAAAQSRSVRRARERFCTIHTSNEQFNDWLRRSIADLQMMTTATPYGPYPYAGVPWFSTVFGRDGILTALECLWVNPELARGVMSYLAATQADAIDAERDAEPGKILHETRHGEMAALGEIPFGRYYGSVDSTPLFVLLAGAYYECTGDRDFVAKIWPNILRALEWVDTYGDQDRDGFVEYHRRSATGLAQQGWKDSHDSVFHADGTSAEGPIALAEVQGYVFAAKRYAAELASVLGHEELATKLAVQTNELREAFERRFWCEDLGVYALALDGNKQPCRLVTSNAGQCLFSRIANPRRAQRIADRLLEDDSFSGWGIRTLAANQARYNPMSYHNGSVWPHDNAMVAQGFAHYQQKQAALRVLSGMFDATLYVDLHRMPELFCGFPRRADEGPTLYPVACAPQSWAAASVFMLLAAALGLTVHGAEATLRFSYPALPEFLNDVYIPDLRVGSATADLHLTRHPDDVGINVLRRHGKFEVVIVK